MTEQAVVQFPGSLRDWFAVTATDSDLRDPTIPECVKLLGIETYEYRAQLHWHKVRALLRYQYADAMLAEHAKEQKA